MESLEEKLTRLVAEHLRDGRADLETFPDGHLAGHVISSEFDELSFEQRRKHLWTMLNQHLSPDESRQISLLLTYTPEEWDVPLENEG